MDELDQARRWYSWEAFMVQHVGSNLSHREFAWLDAISAGWTSKNALHAPWVIRSVRFLINWLKDSHIFTRLFHEVWAAGALPAEFWGQFLFDPSCRPLDTLLSGGGNALPRQMLDRVLNCCIFYLSVLKAVLLILWLSLFNDVKLNFYNKRRH